jgi:hypothetical protein
MLYPKGNKKYKNNNLSLVFIYYYKHTHFIMCVSVFNTFSTVQYACPFTHAMYMYNTVSHVIHRFVLWRDPEADSIYMYCVKNN